MQDVLTIATSDDKRYRVRLAHDDAQANPRTEYDTNLTYALTVPHSRYEDVAQPGPLVDEWNRIKDRDDAMDLFERWAKIFHGATTERYTPAQGANSVWYILPEQAKEIGPEISPEQVLEDEIKEYQAWAEGDVYGYIIEKAVDWKRSDGKDDSGMTTWEEVDEGSCWQLIGYEYAEEEAKREFKAFLERLPS